MFCFFNGCKKHCCHPAPGFVLSCFLVVLPQLHNPGYSYYKSCCLDWRPQTGDSPGNFVSFSIPLGFMSRCLTLPAGSFIGNFKGSVLLASQLGRRSHTHTHARTEAHRQARTHAGTHAHRHARTHAHTHNAYSRANTFYTRVLQTVLQFLRIVSKYY